MVATAAAGRAPEARAAAAEAEALRRQLLERVRMREAAGWLERRPQLGHAVFARGMSAATPSGRASDITELLRGCLVALRVPAAQADEVRPRPPRLWQVTDAIARIQRLLDVLPDASALATACRRRTVRVSDRLRCLVALRVPAAQAGEARPRPPRLWQVTEAIARIQRLLDAAARCQSAERLPAGAGRCRIRPPVAPPGRGRQHAGGRAGTGPDRDSGAGSGCRVDRHPGRPTPRPS